MIQTESIDEMRAAIADWREAGDRVALVPTMGNLHRGHASLVKLARERADRVVVSIFVNPTQFGAGEDFGVYPRTLELDSLLLKRTRADLLFAPQVSDVYPFGQGGATRIYVPELTEEFCGEFRPGHFDGVATVVTRFFFMTQPDIAVFGQKDYQQLLIIRRLVSDMSVPIEIVSGPTVREKDGLAISSRNQYLSEDERRVAPKLFKTLRRTAAALIAQRRDFEALEHEAHEKLISYGFVPEYVAIRNASSLSAPAADSSELVILCAAGLGRTRLIDNLLVQYSS